MEKKKPNMTQFEKSAIIGYWRCGASYQLIGMTMGVSASYAEFVVTEYLSRKSKS